MNQILEQARDPFGGPRFYPAGQHPAAHRQRWFLRKLYELLRARLVDTSEVDKAIDYAQRQIDAVEQGELIAKAHYLLRSKLSDTKEAG